MERPRVLFLCPRVWPGVSKRLHWPVEDPALVEGDGRLDAFRAARDDLDARVREWLATEAPHEHAEQ